MDQGKYEVIVRDKSTNDRWSFMVNAVNFAGAFVKAKKIVTENGQKNQEIIIISKDYDA